MKKIIKITESQIKNIVKIVLEQDNSEEEWVKVPASEFLELMNLASYYTYGVSRLPKFRGKKIWVVGNVNLNNTPTKDLNGVGYIEGDLDITNTDIADLSKLKVKGYVRDWNSGVSRLRAKLERQRKASGD
jgi:LDH2 family malate/lactate/ureidoglycolate dehydrogenase